MSFVSIQPRRSFPVRVEPVVRSDAAKAARKARAAAKKPAPTTAKRRPGRPKGSKNTPKAAGTLAPEFGRIAGMLDALRPWIAGGVARTSLGLDGPCGNHNALQRARQHHLHLIATLRCDAARSFPSLGPYAGRGPHRQDGRKGDDDHIPAQSLQETPVDGPIQTSLYQAQLLHQECTPPLQVVSLVQPNRRTPARAHGSLLSSDLDLAYAPLVDYSGLRFQSAGTFRDAKQSWGLEACMTVTPAGVTKAAHLSLFMVHVSYRLRGALQPRDPDSSVLDLKADSRGCQYVEETITMLPEKPEPIL